MNRTIGIIFANYTSERIAPLVKNRALGSIPFGGRYRLIDFPLDNMVNSGIRYLSVVTPYNYRSLVEHLGHGKNWGIGRKAGHLYLLPGSIYGMGTGYTKFLLRDIIQNRSFITANDSDYVLCSASGVICNMDCNEVLEYHKAHKEPITLVYKEIEKDPTNQQTGNYLQIDEDGKVNAIVFKPQGHGKLFMEYMLIDRAYLLKLIDWYSALSHMDLIEIIAKNLATIKVNAYEYKGYVRSITSVRGYMRASMDLMIPEIREELFGNDNRKIYTNIQDKAPTYYPTSAKVKNSFVSAGCTIKGTVENCVIFRDVVVEKGAVLKNCILMQAASVGKYVQLENVILDKYVHINEDRTITGTANDPVVIGEEANY